MSWKSLICFLYSIALCLPVCGQGFNSQNPGGIVSQRIHEATCRITVDEGNGMASFGSGTYFAADQNSGMILTCSHVAGRNPITTFPNGERFFGRVLYVSTDECSVIQIAKPKSVQPVPMRDDAPPIGSQLLLSGYGSTTNDLSGYRQTAGQLTSEENSIGMRFSHGIVSSTVRNGDSGGGVFDDQGRLCGVVWGGDTKDESGQSDNSSRVTIGAPVYESLDSAGALGSQHLKPSQLVSLMGCYGSGCCSNGCSSGSCSYGGQCGMGGCSGGCYPSGGCSSSGCSDGSCASVYPTQQPTSRPASSQTTSINNAVQTLYENQKKIYDQYTSINNKITNQASASSCSCSDKWSALDTRLTGIETSIAAIKPCQCDHAGQTAQITEINNRLTQIETTIANQKQTPVAATPDPPTKAPLILEGIVRQVPK